MYHQSIFMTFVTYVYDFLVSCVPKPIHLICQKKIFGLVLVDLSGETHVLAN